MTTPEFGILGAGAQAREVAGFVVDARVAFYAVSAEFATEDGFIDIAAPTAAEASTPVIAAVGAPALRRKLIRDWPGRDYRSVVSPGAYVSPSAQIGKGSVIAPGVVVSSDTRIGDHVTVNIGTTISHDCVVGDYATISPGVHIAGRCEVGQGAFLGIGCIVRDGIRIGAGSIIGAGAVVLADTPDLGVCVGNPARLVRTADDWPWSF